MTDLQKAKLRQLLRESDAIIDDVMLWLAASKWTPVIVFAWTAAAFTAGVWVGWGK